MSRGQRTVIRDVATAIAASKCWLARWNGGTAPRMLGIAIDAFHPQDCGFCEYPPQKLISAVTEFSQWASLFDADSLDEPQPVREEIEKWETLPKEEQRRLVLNAQGYLEVDGEGDGH